MATEFTADQRSLVDELLPRCQFALPGTPVICAVSGGADSVALLILAVGSGLIPTAVHIDHGLRPNSEREADVVANVAQSLGAAFRSERVELADGGDLEARARSARRSVLGPDALTGHTADDQAETLLINLLRGTGVAGLSGMRPGPSKPILNLRRSETMALCDAFGFDPVMDESNLDPRFVRNRIRHELLPLMADIANRDLVPLLNRTALRSRMITDEIDAEAREIDPSSCEELRAAPSEVAAAALRRWLRDGSGHPPSTAEVERVLAVVNLTATATELSGGRRLSRSGGTLRIDDPPLSNGR